MAKSHHLEKDFFSGLWSICSVIGADRDRNSVVGFIDDAKDLLFVLSFPEKLVELIKLRSTRSLDKFVLSSLRS